MSITCPLSPGEAGDRRRGAGGNSPTPIGGEASRGESPTEREPAANSERQNAKPDGSAAVGDAGDRRRGDVAGRLGLRPPPPLPFICSDAEMACRHPADRRRR